MDRFIDIFIEETREILEKIEKLLLNLEHNSTIEVDEVHDLFRYIHTLKGNSLSIGFKYFSKIAHELESFLDTMRHNKIENSSKIPELLINGYDLLNEILSLEIDKTIDDATFKLKTDSYIKELQNYDSKNDLEKIDRIQEKIDSSEERFGFFNDEDAVKEETLSSVNVTSTIKPSSNTVASSSIRINLSKIDKLMNDIGELVIAMSMLDQFTQSIDNDRIKNGFNERIGYLRHILRDLQDSVMSTRMVPMEHVYSKFPKLVRDIAKDLKKEITFNTSGDDVEIDKAMIEGLSDPLIHIIRNACDHGIETPKDRLMAGKSKEGTIHIGATQANEQIIISISDDGKGIDEQRIVEKAIDAGVTSHERVKSLSISEKLSFIFEPGLSTASNITDISGRGVGMDVVRSNINRLGGSIKIDSEVDKGTTLKLILPLTLAIVEVLNVIVGDSSFFLPLASIVESLQPHESMIKSLGNSNNEVLILREEAIPIIRLHDIFNIPTKSENLEHGMIIIVRFGTSKVSIFVDMFLNQQQVVIKPIDKNFKPIEGFSGASIKGDGSIGLILDVAAIAQMYRRNKEIS